MKLFRILIVDDDDNDVDVTLTLKVGLEENGFAVDFFNDAKTASTNFKPHVYDIILIDVKMPTMNGFEFYKGVKKVLNIC